MRRGPLAIAILAMGLFGAAAARAATTSYDYAFYPGIMCRDAFSSTDEVWYTYFGGFWNRNTSAQSALCPVPTQQLTWHDRFDVTVAVNDNSSSADFRCKMYARNLLGNGGSSTGDHLSSGTGGQTLTMSSTELSSASWANVVLYCVVPPNGRIGGYYISERYTH